MREQFTKLIFLSAERKENSPERNRQLTQNIISDMLEMRLNFVASKGYFEGQEEDSFMVYVRNNDEIDSLCHLAFKVYKQDSVLFQNNEGQAILMENNFNNKLLGKLVEVDSTEGLEGYTIVNGKIITIK